MPSAAPGYDKKSSKTRQNDVNRIHTLAVSRRAVASASSSRVSTSISLIRDVIRSACFLKGSTVREVEPCTGRKQWHGTNKVGQDAKRKMNRYFLGSSAEPSIHPRFDRSRSRALRNDTRYIRSIFEKHGGVLRSLGSRLTTTYTCRRYLNNDYGGS